MTSSVIERALIRAQSVKAVARSVRRGSGMMEFDPSPSSPLSQFAGWRSQQAHRTRYSLFSGWVYSAVNAIASEAAMQDVIVARTISRGRPEKARRPINARKVPSRLRQKASRDELEILSTHPALDSILMPNPIQRKWQLVYSFVANLCLTGWSYLIVGPREDGEGVELYSIPTTWVTPLHTDGPFSHFLVRNPNDPSSDVDATPFTREQVVFAYLPNPADPFSALAPAAAQQNAVSIDDKIQTSQETFFDNGVFPSVVVTVGRNPHPDIPEGVRPRLTADQRRQVIAAIKKVTGGIANYGNPAIIDGLIESIDRLSATQNEMGWEKSEKTVRSRILSAFSVHPFILGEEMAGSYAQAYVVQSRFCRRVNVYLDLMSGLLTELYRQLGDETVEVWLDPCEAVDPSQEQSLWTAARKNQDVTQNEFRAYMGLPPDEDRNESVIDRQSLTGVLQVAAQVRGGQLEQSQAVAILEGLGMPSDLAQRIAGEGQDPQLEARLQEQLQQMEDAVDETEKYARLIESQYALAEKVFCPTGSAGGGSGEYVAITQDIPKNAGIKVDPLDLDGGEPIPEMPAS